MVAAAIYTEFVSCSCQAWYIPFLKLSSAHQSFMEQCTYQLNVGNFSLESWSVPQKCQTLGLATPLVNLWMCMFIQDSVRLPSLHSISQWWWLPQESLRTPYDRYSLQAVFSQQKVLWTMPCQLPGSFQLILLTHAPIFWVQWHYIYGYFDLDAHLITPTDASPFDTSEDCASHHHPLL